MGRSLVKACVRLSFTIVVCSQLASSRYLNEVAFREKRSVVSSPEITSSDKSNANDSKAVVSNQMSSDGEASFSNISQAEHLSVVESSPVIKNDNPVLDDERKTDPTTIPSISKDSTITKSNETESYFSNNNQNLSSYENYTDPLSVFKSPFVAENNKPVLDESKTVSLTTPGTEKHPSTTQINNSGGFFPNIAQADIILQKAVENTTPASKENVATISSVVESSSTYKPNVTEALIPDISQAGIVLNKTVESAMLPSNNPSDELEVNANVTVPQTTASSEEDSSTTKPVDHGSYFPNINQSFSSSQNYTDPLSVVKAPPVSGDTQCDDGFVFDKGICRKVPNI